MRRIERILFLVGIVCLALYGFFTVQAHWEQYELERELERSSIYAPKDPSTDSSGRPEAGPPEAAPPNASPPKVGVTRNMKEGDLVGRLEVPRLDVSVMVMHGTGDKTLRLGAGHIPGTALPGDAGNAGIAAHRDTFFRNLRNITKDDVIKFTTVDGEISYRVSNTMVVNPSDIDVLKPASVDMLTLVTCFPFYYVGPAPKRFIVQAIRAD